MQLLSSPTFFRSPMARETARRPLPRCLRGHQPRHRRRLYGRGRTLSNHMSSSLDHHVVVETCTLEQRTAVHFVRLNMNEHLKPKNNYSIIYHRLFDSSIDRIVANVVLYANR